MQTIKAKPANYINTDIGFTHPQDVLNEKVKQTLSDIGLAIPDDVKKQLEDADNKIPFILISFGADDEPIDQKALSIRETRQIICDLLSSLAILGDPLAKRIGDEYFGS